MHEMSIAEGIIQILQEQAFEQHYRQVKTVWLEIGPLAMIEVDSLCFCFDAVAKGTLAEGAKLSIIKLEGLAQCHKCQQQVAVKQHFDPCPRCGSYDLQIIQGDEMRIKELEVE